VWPSLVVWKALFEVGKCLICFLYPLELFIRFFHECIEREGLFAKPCDESTQCCDPSC
jgi:hypothetical protein